MANGVLGVGGALMDLLLKADDEFVAAMGAAKGGMTLVSIEEMENALAKATTPPESVPGGSACNTMTGLAQLGVQSRFIGVVGPDDLAQEFSQGIKASGVDARLRVADTPTGRVLSVVTPDAQRSMFSFLGAAAQLQPQDLQAELYEDMGWILVEGYQVFNPPVFKQAMKVAKQQGVKVVLDLASFQVVAAGRALFEECVSMVDVLIANEDEALAFTGLAETAALQKMATLCPLAVLKLGAKGAMIQQGEQVIQVEALRVQALDTTAAGDLWASGFLYGLSKGWSLANCGKAAAIVAADVVQVMGSVIAPERWDAIRQQLATLSE
jgi:sugar/nucleoside kinase (ribokinase family)